MSLGLVILVFITFVIVLSVAWLWFFNLVKPQGDNFLKKGLKAFEKKDLLKAKELLNKSKKMTPEVLQKLGQSCFELGQYEEAQAHYEQLLINSPKNLEALSALAKILQIQGKSEEAIEVFEKNIAENGKDINSYLGLGDSHQALGDFQKALEILEKAKELQPENTEVLLSIAKCKSELFDPDNEEEAQKIIEEYKKIAELGNTPQDYEASIAKVYAKTGDIESAYDSCKKALELNDKDVESYRLLGLIQLINNDLEGAKNSLATALSFEKGDNETHNVFSYLLCLQVDDCTKGKCREKYFSLVKKHLK